MSASSSFKFQISNFSPGRPLILGHRGAPTEFQENTIASFKRALEEGADGVELDVRQTGNGKLVVFHDDSLYPGLPLIETHLDDLRDIARERNLNLNTLDEVLRELAGKGFINIELKEFGVSAAAVDLAGTILPAASYVFSSFLPVAIGECRRLAPDVPAIFITDSCRDPERVLQLMENMDASGIGLWHKALTPALASQFTAREFPIFVWTVNDPAEARELAQMGVAGIISDVPAILIRALART